MYQPPHFREDSLPVLHDAIAATGLATIVAMTPSGLEAVHLPLLLDRQAGPMGTLIGHVARANPIWREADAGVQALAIFQGPDAYVSPSWYPSKAETHRVVPTWNYVAVHAKGVLAFVHDAAGLLEIVTRLTERHEAGRAAPWAVSDAPADFVERQLKGIVGVRMEIATLEGKWKMSQNRTPADRDGARDGLAASGDAGAAATAALMAKLNG